MPKHTLSRQAGIADYTHTSVPAVFDRQHLKMRYNQLTSPPLQAWRDTPTPPMERDWRWVKVADNLFRPRSFNIQITQVISKNKTTDCIINALQTTDCIINALQTTDCIINVLQKSFVQFQSRIGRNVLFCSNRLILRQDQP